MSKARARLGTQRMKAPPVLYDKSLLLLILGLMLLGLLMVTSSSIALSYKLYGTPFYWLTRQLMYVCLGVLAGSVMLKIPTDFWSQKAHFVLMMSFLLLILVLIPGIGRSVNGSMRWIGLGPLGVQVSELVKLLLIIYMSSYLYRHHRALREDWLGFLKPMILLGVVSGLLLLEPDFGSTGVIWVTMLGMMFLAGVRLWQFCALFLCVVGGLGILAVSAPYRLARLTTFLDPWAHAFKGGYQLTQSLIAFGRGGWFGTGLGESVQKLFYLPEAHTDFIFAVIAEELGLLGACLVVLLFVALVLRAWKIARMAMEQKHFFSAYVACGVGLWLGLQVLINVGVNVGVLPTKGLTLPLLSYGGSSVVVVSMALGLLLRIDYENRLQRYGFSRRR